MPGVFPMKSVIMRIASWSPSKEILPLGEYVSSVLPLAREYRLSAYDASYLELAIRHAAPLATLDGQLQKAAKHAGVKIFAEEKKGR